MASKNPTIDPRRVDDATWFYEERKGLAVVHEVRMGDGSLMRTDQFLIPWRMVTAAIRRRGTANLKSK